MTMSRFIFENIKGSIFKIFPSSKIAEGVIHTRGLMDFTRNAFLANTCSFKIVNSR